ncbi:MAG TPA: aminotransferase class V-fold PLP-dependent enzyme, partial [Polyangiales bacterium]|nr:aminotransferase class V-fold PLP-dependent enzyme [Polyangiales bacterium]
MSHEVARAGLHAALAAFTLVHPHQPRNGDPMPGLLPDVDPDGLLEYSVVYTDRALNHMSAKFQRVMNEISAQLKQVYHARSVAIVPGGGTFAMEAVARQFATGRSVLVVRNGFFSFRWSQILQAGAIASEERVLSARSSAADAAFAPAPLAEVVAEIERLRPAVVFAPHVETASGIVLPDDYLRGLARAVRKVDGLLVIDCIASGAVFLDMAELGIDVLLSA